MNKNFAGDLLGAALSMEEITTILSDPATPTDLYAVAFQALRPHLKSLPFIRSASDTRLLTQLLTAERAYAPDAALLWVSLFVSGVEGFSDGGLSPAWMDLISRARFSTSDMAQIVEASRKSFARGTEYWAPVLGEAINVRVASDDPVVEEAVPGLLGVLDSIISRIVDRHKNGRSYPSYSERDTLSRVFRDLYPYVHLPLLDLVLDHLPAQHWANTMIEYAKLPDAVQGGRIDKFLILKRGEVNLALCKNPALSDADVLRCLESPITYERQWRDALQKAVAERIDAAG